MHYTNSHDLFYNYFNRAVYTLYNVTTLKARADSFECIVLTLSLRGLRFPQYVVITDGEAEKARPVTFARGARASTGTSLKSPRQLYY